MPAPTLTDDVTKSTSPSKPFGDSDDMKRRIIALQSALENSKSEIEFMARDFSNQRTDLEVRIDNDSFMA